MQLLMVEKTNKFPSKPRRDAATGRSGGCIVLFFRVYSASIWRFPFSAITVQSHLFFAVVLQDSGSNVADVARFPLFYFAITLQLTQAVTNLSLAVDQGYGDNTRTEWVRVTVWGEAQSTAAMKYLSKGDLVSVTSESFRVSAWAAQDGSLRGQLEVTARRVDYIITKHQADEAPTDEAPADSIPF
jgi:hypothetical protein